MEKVVGILQCGLHGVTHTVNGKNYILNSAIVVFPDKSYCLLTSKQTPFCEGEFLNGMKRLKEFKKFDEVIFMEFDTSGNFVKLDSNFVSNKKPLIEGTQVEGIIKKINNKNIFQICQY